MLIHSNFPSGKSEFRRCSRKKNSTVKSELLTFSRTDNNSVSCRITRQSTQLPISKTLIIVPNNSIKLDSWRWNHILKLPWVILCYSAGLFYIAMLFIFSVMESNKLKLPAPKNCNEQYRNNYFRTTLTPPSPLTVLEKYSDCLGLWGV